ncbi:hypothetical protein A2W54_04305 [Candidatus Giovannonibacteria bacterium RIFCSPHIGHO2_02_43_13]|uniref:Uncharacterized protein n=1 Tax=Candidatus Giovannonibacteria bacterium RIFCSPHIGHO2_02_43_13 TaxID=1798330 RepID=A0A1F5WQ46_9BACT|nr:MAG: hypothetical protein UW28_C0015G0009 [Parcubacteria group bacterium GW2011_GWA2_44_13]OGF74206.1 MAG: hypothetical protein A3E06_04425 [Candidatus Giovannonibacteria bacterium RIFCSPHIGHO2_12_FULL_44_42]OGF77707.1 MAG: hypothetical protein A2W54_04305 [Candidatus Giovannonibacteria bacterium RIFCSPHIGHO2_02_43_13]OGF88698.1 MAG: hypothetical protein A3I94_03850 [Candidatus Giovannonibacteria bacterium RIFCSPLOWO2_02_FULL_43_54]OGF96898.1 MAG: hypothetical protein A3H08_02580 [Candidatus
MTLTKQDLDAIGKVVEKQINPIVLDVKELKTDMVFVKQEIIEIKHDLSGLREQIQALTITLDKFLKRLTDHEEEFTILKSEMKQVKQVLKEKLGVEFKGAANW